ncbi:helicase HerA-like domain-containing protein [Devosia riboflavina]|uniref:helicase HerA-like domain-containing protein n=1 Tax=Devosia riboflavina TaxID=46914 RepID=UPI00068F3ED3|nr:helicase HerA-like domain-containing protein [Devosia riboflavina]
MTAISIGKTDAATSIALPLRFANRHGLITGATGTGKTVTLQRMAEEFSAAGVPVFAADVKGDLSGIATAAPVTFWDVFGRKGHPIRASVQEMGPVLLARMLSLNDTQAGTLAIALKRAEDQSDFLLSLDDLRWQLQDMQDDRETVCQVYGNITASSIATIQRNILTLEQQGGARLFGEPPFKISDFIREVDGKGVVNLLHADDLMEAPKLYGSLIFWLLTELFRRLPEAGDLDKPKLVFFFDEAHLLFKDAPKHLLESIERIVRLVRSRGVGVYFVTQSPADVPDNVLAQLGNRVQHALRAYTPKEQRFVKAAARAFRPNKAINVEEAVLSMGVGEALVSTLVDDGVPMPVERIKVAKPSGQLGPLSDLERDEAIANSPFRAKYPSVTEGARYIWEFQNRQRAARGLSPLPETEVRERAPMSMDDVLAPLTTLQAARGSHHLRTLMTGLALIAAAGALSLMAGIL